MRPKIQAANSGSKFRQPLQAATVNQLEKPNFLTQISNQTSQLD